MSLPVQKVLVLGAYGFFGSRICAALAKNPRVQLILAGRDLSKATAAAYQLGLSANHAREVDAAKPDLALLLRKLGVNIVIHTAGPFQGQSYGVARSAIKAGCHYLDLADGRAFVNGITRLDAEARAAGVSIISGASSLPALSSAVVDKYRGEFKRLDSIRIGITSGAVIPGVATLRAILGYCGKPFRTLENGQWIDVHGWLDTQSHDFSKLIGVRRISRCDVPDLDLLPQRYRGREDGQLSRRIRQQHRAPGGRAPGDAREDEAIEECAAICAPAVHRGSLAAARVQRSRRHVREARRPA